MPQDAGAETLWKNRNHIRSGLVRFFHGACLKIRKDAVFVPKPVWLGQTREHTPRGSATGEQQRQTGLGAKTFRRRPLGYGGTSRATALLPLGFVVAAVIARHGDAPTAPPRPRPKSPVAAPFPILRQAHRVCAQWIGADWPFEFSFLGLKKTLLSCLPHGIP